MYEVIYDDEPINFLNKLHPNLKERILEGRKDFKLRIGNYRVIADINQNLKKIEVTRIGHRKNIYKN
jgi:mRNA-degrading endonuclease RelE of RelBE toxin-antitoxin system